MPQAMKWTPEVVIATILRLHSEKKPLHSNWMQRHNRLLYAGAVGRFGGWRQAIESAGLDYDEVRAEPPQRKWSKKAVKKEILRRKKLRLSLSASVVAREDGGLDWAATKYFGKGGWRKALTYAGLDYREYDTRIIWTKKRVVETIRERRRNKLPLHLAALEAPEERSLVSGASYAFGSWRNAITAAGFNYATIRLRRGKFWWSKRKVLSKIRRLAERGVKLNSRDIQSDHPSLFGAARYRFGSWPAAVAAAGLNYREHLKIWSTTLWVGQLGDDVYRTVLTRAREMSQKRRHRK